MHKDASVMFDAKTLIPRMVIPKMKQFEKITLLKENENIPN